MQPRFGHFCGVGSQAVELLSSEVYPHLDGGGVNKGKAKALQRTR